jgi:hypothetical protein
MENSSEIIGELLGFQVEKLSNDGAPYMLHGPRGAAYGLIRYQNNRELMYAVNASKLSFGRIVGVCGNYTFTDRDGVLVPLSR